MFMYVHEKWARKCAIPLRSTGSAGLWSCAVYENPYLEIHGDLLEQQCEGLEGRRSHLRRGNGPHFLGYVAPPPRMGEMA